MSNLTNREEAKGEWAAIATAFDAQLAWKAAREGEIPDGWRAVWQSRKTEKEQISIRVDRDVVKFFRSLGPGFGPRMNDVLRAFVLARLAGFIQSPRLPKGLREPWMARAPGPDTVELPRDVAEGVLAFLNGSIDVMRQVAEEEAAETEASRGD